MGEQPLYFTLGEDDEEDAFCNMVGHSEEEESEMQQDSGLTDLDFRRKKVFAIAGSTASAESDWEKVLTDGDEHDTYTGHPKNIPEMPWKKEDTKHVVEETEVEGEH